jgi:methyl-accepting chemotaxis protein
MRLTIGRKLGIAAGITLGFMLAAIAANVIGLNTVRATYARSVRQLQAAQAYKDLVYAQAISYSSMYEYVADGEAADLASYDAARHTAQELTAPSLAYCSGCHPSQAPDIAPVLMSIKSQQGFARSTLQETLAAYKRDPGDTANIRTKLQAAEGVVQGQLAMADQVQSSHEAVIDEQITRNDRDAANLLWVNIGLSVIALVVSAVVVIRLSGGILRSIAHLREAADGMSRGKLDAPIQLKTGDEMEDMAASIERMRASLKVAMDRLRTRSAAP